MVILDTDIIIDFLRKENSTTRKINELKDRDIELITTSINTFELFKGALRSYQEDAAEKLLGLLTNLKILDFNFEASKKAGKIFEDLRVKGKMIDPLDLMIASIALVNNESLLTRNIKHFEKIGELKIES